MRTPTRSTLAVLLFFLSWPCCATRAQQVYTAGSPALPEKIKQKTHYYDMYADMRGSYMAAIQIQHEATKRNFSYAISALLLLLLLVSAGAYNIKRRANLLLQQQQFEINQRNVTLKQLLEERDWLLKEVHHRVKNNLQIVISLLNSQALHLHNETARQALRESKNRMQAISLIHQKLYKSDGFSAVNMDYYVSELLDFLQESFAIRDRVSMDIDLICADLDVSQAVPIGLIINEAVTNAIKHAVPYAGQPHIHIQLHDDNDQVVLSITDNGAGFPPDLDPQASDSFGLNLIVGLARQLRGNVAFNSDTGLRIAVSFPQSHILAELDNSQCRF